MLGQERRGTRGVPATKTARGVGKATRVAIHDTSSKLQVVDALSKTTLAIPSFFPRADKQPHESHVNYKKAIHQVSCLPLHKNHERNLTGAVSLRRSRQPLPVRLAQPQQAVQGHSFGSCSSPSLRSSGHPLSYGSPMRPCSSADPSALDRSCPLDPVLGLSLGSKTIVPERLFVVREHNHHRVGSVLCFHDVFANDAVCFHTLVITEVAIHVKAIPEKVSLFRNQDVSVGRSLSTPQPRSLSCPS